MARGVAAQLVHITKYTTLGRGDVVLGGSPTSMYAVHAGDKVEIEIEGIGTLANSVVGSYFTPTISITFIKVSGLPTLPGTTT